MHVIKIGGAVCQDDAVLAKLAHAWNTRTDDAPWVLVHGGGPQLTAALADLGEAPRRVEGLRVTSPRAATTVAETLDEVGARLAAALCGAGIPAHHVAATEGLFHAVAKDEEALGRVGTVTSFEGRTLESRIKGAPAVLVVTPVGWDAEGPLNVNADEGALAVATAVQAQRLVLVTDVPAVRGAQGHGLSMLMPPEAEMLIRNGTAKGGMVPKLRSALEALRTGVDEVAIGGLDLLSDPDAGTRVFAGAEAVAEAAEEALAEAAEVAGAAA